MRTTHPPLHPRRLTRFLAGLIGGALTVSARVAASMTADVITADPGCAQSQR